MAKISTAVNESVFKIDRWLGVNQSPEGESRLRYGEAADMRNFRITAGGALRKRPGSRNVAGLLNGYVVSVDESKTETLLNETGSSTATFTMHPTVTADSLGNLVLSGEPVVVTNASADTCVGYYFKDSDGNVHRFAGLSRTSVEEG